MVFIFIVFRMSVLHLFPEVSSINLDLILLIKSFAEDVKNSFVPIFSFCKSETHANIRRGAQIWYHFRYFRPFILRCGISRTSLDRMSNFSTRPLMRSLVQWYPFISPVFWCLGQRAKAMSRELGRNPIISLAGCHVGAAVTRQVFSFITYESGRPSSFQPDRGIKQDFTDKAR